MHIHLGAWHTRTLCCGDMRVPLAHYTTTVFPYMYFYIAAQYTVTILAYSRNTI